MKRDSKNSSYFLTTEQNSSGERKKQICLELEQLEIKDMVKNQQDFKKEEEQKVEQPNQPEEQTESQEGRKPYATKFGEKCRFDGTRKGFNDFPNFEKKACPMCKERTKEILNSSGSSSSTQSATILGFEVKG